MGVFWALDTLFYSNICSVQKLIMSLPLAVFLDSNFYIPYGEHLGCLIIIIIIIVPFIVLYKFLRRSQEVRW